ncbi:MAG TPA: serine/threonine-protein kinase [Kofleriaceae bacterium]
MNCLDDATVLGLVEGRLAAELIARVDEHIDTCASCRDVVTLVASTRSPGRVLARGDTVDRYVIGDLLGTGAMGRVYSAWEPELDRRVAIKVLHEEGGRDRLVREAQAMARLNHPNVVTVHEVGSTDAGVFVAMELVEGETLRAWAQQPRQWREVVRVLVEVARGLAAVHAAGVIHRDVKPDNVIVGSDGRVRLGDFGLARSGGAPTTAPAAASFALGTLTGGTQVAGTPAYMAPELLRGGAATAASDQFSFGVMAYELLAGKRPFDGATWADLVRAIDTHDVRAVPDVASWLDVVVQRCIAVEPGQRHKSMQVVADALATGLARRRPTLWVAAIATIAVLASAMTYFVARVPARIAPYDEADFTLTAPLRANLLQRGVTPTTIATIDRWIDGWNTERKAIKTSGTIDQIAARERCMMQRRDEVAALLEGASEAPARLADAIAAMPPASECRAADSDPLPADDRGRIAREVLAELPAIRARLALGGAPRLGEEAAQHIDRVRDSDDAPPPARPTQSLADDAAMLVERARASGHAPTLADALLVQAEALRLVDRGDDAALAARDAVVAAERGHADLLRAHAWLARVAIAGEQRDLAAAEDLGAIAQAAIDRVGAPHLAATLARLRGLIAYNRGRLDEARAFLLDARKQFIALELQNAPAIVPRDRHEAALAAALRERSAERTLDVAAVDSALGSVARAAGDLDEAERRHWDVLKLDRELRGTLHRDVARDLHNVAGVRRLRGELELALAFYREALAVEIATQGERSVAAGLTHNSIGLVELERKDYAAAQADFEIAREILASANHGDRAFAEHNLGLVVQARGAHQAALAHFDAAAKIYATTIGADAPAATRLIADRQLSEQALHIVARRKPVAAPTAKPAAVTQPAAVAQPTKPAPSDPAKPATKRDVGVYGSAQSW